MDKKRSLGGTSFAPFLIALIPLNEQIDPQSALSILKSCDPDAIVTTSPTGVTHITYVSIFLRALENILPLTVNKLPQDSTFQAAVCIYCAAM